eukprot:scaffold31568_cov101-Isochrysis_galbana.AAC.2
MQQQQLDTAKPAQAEAGAEQTGVERSARNKSAPPRLHTRDARRAPAHLDRKHRPDEPAHLGKLRLHLAPGARGDYEYVARRISRRSKRQRPYRRWRRCTQLVPFVLLRRHRLASGGNCGKARANLF